MAASLHFTIGAPHYTSASNGVMVIYHLGELLESLGHRISFVSLDPRALECNRAQYPQHLLSKFVSDPAEIDPCSIALLPETSPEDIVEKIPCRLRVWYLLNQPYLLTGKPLPYRDTDFVVAYSGLISKGLFNLFINRNNGEISAAIQSAQTPHDKDDMILIYSGKNRTSKFPRSVSNLVKKKSAKVCTITRQSPRSREVLFELLRRARLLVSFDPLTNLNYEATICGTPCYIADNYMHLKYNDFNYPLYGFFEDDALLESSYDNGIPPLQQKQIHDAYKNAIQSNLRIVEEFIRLLHEWVVFINDPSPARANLLSRLNEQRKQNDLRIFEANGRICLADIKARAPMMRPIRDQISRRSQKMLWNAHRNWYKHVLRLEGDALDAKLDLLRIKTDEKHFGDLASS